MVKAIFPQIDYDFWLTKYLWEDFSSMIRMITTMKNKNYIDENIDHNNITSEIKSRIELYINNRCENELFEVFKLIQTWGGKSVGNYTLEIVKNWKTSVKIDENKTTTYFKSYKNFVDKILDNKEIESFYYLLNDSKIKGLSNSFIPKHICFWSGEGDRTKGLPILDDVIAKIVYKVNSAKSVDFIQFINDMQSLSQKINEGRSDEKKLTLSQIEMALFSFAGNYWSTGKTGTKEFKKELKFKKDIEQAYLIAESFTNKPIKANNTRNSNSVKKQFLILKEDIIIYTDGTIYVSNIYVSKNKKILKLININSSIKTKNKIEYLKFIGSKEQIEIIG